MNIETDEETRYILLEPGFGFCLGKRGKYARVFLSSPESAENCFIDSKLKASHSHAMFFGCDRGDLESWRGALNGDSPAEEYNRKHNTRKSADQVGAKDSDRCRRLGIESWNNKRNYIRIAPMRGSDLPGSFLSQKIGVVEKWIKDTLTQATLNPTPSNMTVAKGIERPQDGDPFEVLWVKFDFDENMWHDEVMWDIRYILMGSKMKKLPGFPPGLSCAREKMYISRDGTSERKRKLGRV